MQEKNSMQDDREHTMKDLGENREWQLKNLSGKLSDNCPNSVSVDHFLYVCVSVYVRVLVCIYVCMFTFCVETRGEPRLGCHSLSAFHLSLATGSLTGPPNQADWAGYPESPRSCLSLLYLFGAGITRASHHAQL